MTDRLLTENEASVFLGGTSPKTLQRWRWAGMPPKFVKIGRNVRYSQAELENFIRTRTYSSTTEYTEAHRGRAS